MYITVNPELTVPVGPTPGRSYAPDSPERYSIATALAEIRSTEFDVPNIVAGEQIFTNDKTQLEIPHDHSAKLGFFHNSTDQLVQDAIDSATSTAKSWGALDWQERAIPFLKAAELLEDGPWRDRLDAATMLELSKTNYQADGDATCETVDLIRANFKNFAELIKLQPSSSENVLNSLEYRSLEGFVFAISPFNFTSMSHLAFGPAFLGNTVVWKPAESATLVSYLSLQLLIEAGLPAGVINLVLGQGSKIAPQVLSNKDLAAVSFTGSTNTFQSIFRKVGENVALYRNYPRIVGETGGKGFVFIHPSANVDAAVTACVRGAFEYQGQKCSAATRVYVAKSIWPQMREQLIEATKQVVVGDPTLPETFMGAVINEKQFNLHADVLRNAKENAQVLVGGNSDSSKGWFIEPTVLETKDPNSIFMTEEFFGPILSVLVYEDSTWSDVLELIDNSTSYGLAGSIFAQDEKVIQNALAVLRYTAGNISINDKPTGATVGQQPFGGARASGTNDKVGTIFHISRFLSPRAVKRQNSPALDFIYPHHQSN